MPHRLWIATGALVLIACGSNRTPQQASYSAQAPTRQYPTDQNVPRRASSYPRPTGPAAPAMPTAGNFAWASSLSEAKSSARSTGRLIFLEAGRPGCGNCLALKNKVVPDPTVRGELGAVAVGFYDDVDQNPNSEAVRILYANLPRAVMLPLAGWVTPDMRWVYGFSGATSPSKFRQDIATARASYMRMAEVERPAARRAMAVAPSTTSSLSDAELADVVAELGEDAERDLATAPPTAPPTAVAPTVTEMAPTPAAVVVAAPESVPSAHAPTVATVFAPAPEPVSSSPAPTLASTVAPTFGRSADDAATRAWARENLEHAKARLTTRDYVGARAILAEVRAKAIGMPEEREAEKGEVAIYNLRKIERTSEAADAARAREQAQRDLKNTVWASLFA